MNKLEKAYKIIKNRLPKSYNIPKIKIYKTVYSMLKSVAREENESYHETKKYYANYYKKLDKQKERNYISSKYFSTNEKIPTCFDIAALSGNPIKINIQHTKQNSLSENIFLILHEIGHFYYKPKGRYYNERLCDLFAIRWTRRMEKEGIIK